VAVVDDTVVQEIRVEASPEEVFPYFVEVERLLVWQGVSASLDPRPGGVYRVDVNGRDVALGEYVVVDPPHRVVFTWGWEGNTAVPPGGSTVEVTLSPQDGATLVRLVHSGLPVPAVGEHDLGWTHFAERLAVAAGGGDPGPDPWVQPG
jgi:uncharacterized protein YndB with AHSA1/START domain